MASLISFLVSAGSDISVLGKLTPFLERNGPPCITVASTSVLPSVLST